MIYKLILLILILMMFASLSTAFVTMYQDLGSQSKRTVYLLSIRVSLAVLIVLMFIYGLHQGILEIRAPWHQKY